MQRLHWLVLFGCLLSSTTLAQIDPPPIFTKVFAPDVVASNATTILTFTVDNSASATAAIDLDFTDNLPALMVVASPANASTTCTGGTLTATSGAGVVAYTGGSVSAGASCQISVDILAPGNAGSYVNTTGDLTSSLGNSGTASDTLTVTNVPGFSKAFAPASVAVSGTSTLTFTVDNSANAVSATAIDFIDNLPAGLVVATPAGASTTCTGGTITAVDGTATVSYTGGTVSAGSTCSVSVDTTSSTSGVYNNVSGDMTSSLGNSGSASATLTVNPSPEFGSSFSPTSITPGQTSTLSFTVNNSSSTDVASALAFSLALPSGLEVASPSNIVDNCGGSLIASGSTLDYSAGSVAAGSTCNISLDVTSYASSGSYSPTTTLTSSLGSSTGTMLSGALVVAAIATAAPTALPMLSNWSLMLLIAMIVGSMIIRRRQIFG